MFRLITRWIALIFVIIAASLILASTIGRMLNPYPPVIVSNFESPQRNINTMVDITTGVYQSVSYRFGYYTFHSRRNLAYRTDRDDDLTRIYIKRTWQTREREVAVIPRMGIVVKSYWSFDFDDPFYIIEQTPDSSDIVHIKAINLTTGDVTEVGQFPFSGLPEGAYVMDETYFFMQTYEREFLVIDMASGHYFGDRIRGITTAFYPDNNILLYESKTEDSTVARTRYQIHQLHMSDFTVTEHTLPDPDRFINQINLWTGNETLVVQDNLDHVWLYHVPGDTFTELPPEYHFMRSGTGWSRDGQYVTMFRRIDDMTVDIGYYQPETDSFTTLYTVDDRVDYLTLGSYPNLNWSYDANLIMVSPLSATGDPDFTVYDVPSGEVLFDETAIPPGLEGFVYWGYVPR